uniref:Membrane protein BRI3 n=1 Tax=Panagrolaimus sp. PS1159 TaxID=55785 RepID=A0AC35GA18_9BILA
MTYAEKSEIPPFIQAPPPQIGFIPPTFEIHPPPPPYAPTIIIQPANLCRTCQNGTYELQWDVCALVLIILIFILFLPIGVFACLCLSQAREIRCNNCNAKKPKTIILRQNV